jgi:hypothetical protein
MPYHWDRPVAIWPFSAPSWTPGRRKTSGNPSSSLPGHRPLPLRCVIRGLRELAPAWGPISPFDGRVQERIRRADGVAVSRPPPLVVALQRVESHRIGAVVRADRAATQDVARIERARPARRSRRSTTGSRNGSDPPRRAPRRVDPPAAISSSHSPPLKARGMGAGGRVDRATQAAARPAGRPEDTAGPSRVSTSSWQTCPTRVVLRPMPPRPAGRPLRLSLYTDGSLRSASRDIVPGLFAHRPRSPPNMDAARI